MQKKYSFCVLCDFLRLDSALHDILQNSRSQVAQWIEQEIVFVNNQVAKKSKNLKTRDMINIIMPQHNANMQNTDFSDIQIEVIAETENYLILNKPRNLVVHRAPSVKDRTLTDFLKIKNYKLSTLSGEERYGIVHRLDKDTSGAILIAKNNESHGYFANMLKNRSMGRIYICIVNKPLKENCVVECFIGRNPTNRLKMAKLDKVKFKTARDSKSEFRKIIVSKNGEYELIGVRLFSGRTHQIRVHLSTLDRYIYGDKLYSPEKLRQKYTTRMLLHAQILYFEDKFFSAKIPKDLVKFLEENFLDYKTALKSCLTQWQKELQLCL